MGFYYRRAVNLGPFRVNVGSRGVGYSIGGRGFRTGVSAGGRRYSTFSIPGTGFGYRTSGPRVGCGLLIVAGAGLIGLGAAAAGAWRLL